MTEKEWIELREWAKTKKYIVVEYDQQDGDSEDEYPLVVEDNYICHNGLIFEKDGSIWLEYYQDIVAENRTAKQIKAIIENLL